MRSETKKLVHRNWKNMTFETEREREKAKEQMGNNNVENVLKCTQVGKRKRNICLVALRNNLTEEK